MTYQPPPPPYGQPYQPYQPNPGLPPYPAAKPPWWKSWWAIGLAGVVVGIGIGYAAGAAGKTNDANKQPAAVGAPTAGPKTEVLTPSPSPSSHFTLPSSAYASPPPAQAPKPHNPKPKAADFRIKLRIRSKSCFGSAGCNITYQISPKYDGPSDLSHGDWEVTYKVTGGDSGAQVNTFSIHNGRASFDNEEFISTGPSYQLQAVATHVHRR